eukprot:scaffold79156_cov36-Phaeocystis_antarctica.AAC.2
MQHNWFPARVFVGDTYCYFAGNVLLGLGLGHLLLLRWHDLCGRNPIPSPKPNPHPNPHPDPDPNPHQA